MKFRKICRLEFVSDKIEGVDSKREVVCIRFGCPTKKKTLVRALHGRAVMAGVGAHGRSWESLPAREERGKGRGRGGHSWGGGTRGAVLEGVWPGLLHAVSLFVTACRS
jgi:hypothetical protein